MSQSPRVVTIGEAMLFLTPEHQGALERARRLDLRVGGSEVNVAVGLARLGIPAAWISKLPDNPLAKGMVNTIRGMGVDTTGIVWDSEGRVGIIYAETGSPPRPNRVIYDRTHSSATTLAPEEVDWQFVRSATHLHLTGITAAIGGACLKTMKRSLDEAREGGLTISFDVNFRSNMWTPQKAAETLGPLLLGSDVLFVSDQEARSIFSLRGEQDQVAGKLREKFDAGVIVLSLGERGAFVLADRIYRSEPYQAVVLNRFGVGDAFNAGFLYGFLNGDTEAGLEYGSAAAALKLSTPDENFPLITKSDVEALIERGKTDLNPNEISR